MYNKTSNQIYKKTRNKNGSIKKIVLFCFIYNKMSNKISKKQNKKQKIKQLIY